MRLDKYIASVTDLSRAQVKQAIRNGQVRVGDAPAIGADQQVDPGVVVCVDGRAIAAPGNRYFMVHKPLDCVCATRDRSHTTVLDLLDEPNLERLHIAGRLDIDTTGLVLVTDDGQWSHRITSPRHDCSKVYHVQTAEPIAAETVQQFQRGVFLREEKHRTLPAQLDIVDTHQAVLTLQEGRYHQVKRMFAAVGNRVVGLHRERIGAIRLDASLPPGQYRALTEAEIDSVMSP